MVIMRIYLDKKYVEQARELMGDNCLEWVTELGGQMRIWEEYRGMFDRRLRDANIPHVILETPTKC